MIQRKAKEGASLIRGYTEVLGELNYRTSFQYDVRSFSSRDRLTLRVGIYARLKCVSYTYAFIFPGPYPYSKPNTPIPRIDSKHFQYRRST